MDINITTAQRVHLEFIFKSQIDMALETEDFQLEAEVVRKGVTAVFDDPTKGRYLIAEVEGEAVGVLLIVNEWSDWRNANVLWVHSVFIVEAQRGKGIYKAMYKHIQEEVLADEQLGGVRLYVDKRNKKAIKVYESLGMGDEHYSLFEWLK